MNKSQTPRPNGLADRSNTFYWQTDRDIDPAAAGRVWADRHRYFSDDEVVMRVNEVLGDNKLASIKQLDSNSQTNLGNVNSVRIGVLTSGQEVVIRCHPKAIENGYFHAEAAASSAAKAHWLPSYSTLAIHDFEGGDDFAFHVLEKLPGTAIQKWLEDRPTDEFTLIRKAGRMMARIHEINTDGFGPFDNAAAKKGELRGVHDTHASAVRAALPFNLRVLTQEGVLSKLQSSAIIDLFDASNPLLQLDQAVLVHNDFADWNLLTDGEDVTGILDWDECVAGDPVGDIACWSTILEPNRLEPFLEGYHSIAKISPDFNERFELMRLRYTISKMTLRLRRYSWEPSESIRQKIAIGKTHLAASLEHFDIS